MGPCVTWIHYGGGIAIAAPGLDPGEAWGVNGPGWCSDCKDRGVEAGKGKALCLSNTP